MKEKFELVLQQVKENDPTLISVKFKKTKIGDVGVEQLVEALKTNTWVTSINLVDCNITEVGAKHISEFLKNNTTLKNLNIPGNPIGGVGASYLGSALKTNTTLIFIGLGVTKMDDLGAKAIGNALKINTTLKTIDIGGNNFSDVAMEEIGEAIKKNVGLSLIQLGMTKMSDTGMKNICKALIINSTLEEIALRWNSISKLGAQYLSEVFKINASLTVIDLVGCDLNDEKIRVISTALEDNLSITEIHLADNDIGDTGAQHLSNMFKINSTLKSINLDNNRIGNSGMKYISNALKSNTTLSSISLGGTNDFSEQGFLWISQAIAINTTLRYINVNQIVAGFNLMTENSIQYLRDALKKNYTLLKFNPQNDPQIETYIERNKVIDTVLEPIRSYDKELTAKLDGKDILIKLTELESIIELWAKDNQKEESYLLESKRLLTALGHMTNFNQEIEAFNCLLEPFTNPNFQNVADQVLGQILCGDIALKFKDNPVEQRRRYQLVLHCLKEQLQRTEFKDLIYSALFGLLYPGKIDTHEAIQTLKDNTVLLNYKSLISLVSRALIFCQNDPEQNFYEIRLLENLLQSKYYTPQIASYCCKSATFVSEFKKRYPKANSFILSEDCLFFDYFSKENSPLWKVPNTLSPITKTHSVYFEFNRNPKMIEHLKKKLASFLRNEEQEENYSLGENISLAFKHHDKYIEFLLKKDGNRLINMIVGEDFKEQIIASYQNLPSLIYFLKSRGLTASKIANCIETSLSAITSPTRTISDTSIQNTHERKEILITAQSLAVMLENISKQKNYGFFKTPSCTKWSSLQKDINQQKIDETDISGKTKIHNESQGFGM